MRVLAYLLAVVVIFPLAVLNLLGEETFAGAPAAVFRALSHVGMFATLVLTGLLASAARRRHSDFRVRLDSLAFAILSTVLVILSVIANQAPTNGLLRAASVVLHATNFLLLLPGVLYGSDCRLFIRHLAGSFVAFCIVLFVIAWPYYGGANVARLGYPLMPGVFAYYMLLALISSAAIFRSHLLSWFFLATIALSGSRSSLAIAGAALTLILYRRRKLVLLLLAVITVIVVLNTNYETYLRPFLRERDDVTSGRTQIWRLAAGRIADAPLLGYGTPQIFSIEELGFEAGGETALAAHNSVLDLSLTYGIPYALISVLIWLVCFLPRGWKDEQFDFVIAVWLAVSLRSLVSNTFWTNMGDAATIFALVSLVAYSASHAAPYLNHDGQASVRTLRSAA